MDLRDNPRRRREHPDMEITPLIDVVFLLLIFFLVATSFSEADQTEPEASDDTEESEISVDLPEAETGRGGGETEQMTVFVRADGQVELRGDVEVSGETFEEKLTDLHDRRPEIRILLKGDEKASHGRIIRLFDQLRRIGFKRVHMVTKRPQPDPGSDN